MNNGENRQALRKIVDLSRIGSILLLILHCYYYCFEAFSIWHLTAPLLTKLFGHIARTGLFNSFHISKLLALAFLLTSLIGARGRKTESYTYRKALIPLVIGLGLYFISILVFQIPSIPGDLPPGNSSSGAPVSGEEFASASTAWIAIVYILITFTGWLLVLTGGARLSRIIQMKFRGDIFNRLNESFPQEERLLENQYSINLPARYQGREGVHKSWINIVNPFRGTLILGNPGSGKSYYIVRPIIRQHIEKHFSMLVYDFKYEDLTRIAYDYFLQHRDRYPVPPRFGVIQFDDLSRSHRCNPLDKDFLQDMADVTECARTLLLGLNRDWITKQGNFWVESPINFCTALIAFLAGFQGGKYCTLPHVIELAQVEYKTLFSILRADPRLGSLVNPFVNALQNGAKEQLEGQISGATISLARLSSPALYYIMTGDDISLDISNPRNPAILCLGNNPRKSQVYGSVLSLYMSTIIRNMNQKDRLPCSVVLDEFPTLYVNGIDKFMATARSNKVATTLVVQDASQLKLYYGREQAEVIMGITGNILAGQLRGDAARQVSDAIGRIQQERESISVNSEDTSFSRSRQLDTAIPTSRIANLSSGEFVGIVADNPDQPIRLKAFCAQLLPPPSFTAPASGPAPAFARPSAPVSPAALSSSSTLPLIREVTEQAVRENYTRIRQEVRQFVDEEFIRVSANVGEYGETIH